MKEETTIMPYDEIVQIQRKIAKIFFNYWEETSAFNVPWWCLLLISLLIWGLFILIFEKKYTYPFVLIMFLSQIMYSHIDGEFFSSGSIVYNIRLIPIRFPFIPIDFSFIPVTSAFMYRYCKRWKIYLIATIVVSIALTLAFKYILIPFQVVTFQRGSYLYVFPQAFITFVLARFFTEKIMQLHFKHQG